MDRIDEPGHMFDRCIWQNAMAQIKDMAGPAFGLIQNPSCLSFNQLHRTQKYNRIEISLDGHVVS